MTTKSQAAAEEWTKDNLEMSDAHDEYQMAYLAGWQDGRLEMVEEVRKKSYIFSQARVASYWMVKLSDIEELIKEEKEK